MTCCLQIDDVNGIWNVIYWTEFICSVYAILLLAGRIPEICKCVYIWKTTENIDTSMETTYSYFFLCKKSMTNDSYTFKWNVYFNRTGNLVRQNEIQMIKIANYCYWLVFARNIFSISPITWILTLATAIIKKK